jgi:hypothetical protein
MPMFRHVSKSGQTLGNISEKHRETSNVSEFARKHFWISGSKFCFRNNVSMGGQTGKHLRKHRESQMFPQQCFLVCPGLNNAVCDCSWLMNLPIPGRIWNDSFSSASTAPVTILTLGKAYATEWTPEEGTMENLFSLSLVNFYHIWSKKNAGFWFLLIKT